MSTTIKEISTELKRFFEQFGFTIMVGADVSTADIRITIAKELSLENPEYFEDIAADIWKSLDAMLKSHPDFKDLVHENERLKAIVHELEPYKVNYEMNFKMKHGR